MEATPLVVTRMQVSTVTQGLTTPMDASATRENIILEVPRQPNGQPFPGHDAVPQGQCHLTIMDPSLVGLLKLGAKYKVIIIEDDGA